MITRNMLRVIALASSCLSPLAAFAQAPAPAADTQAPAISLGGTPVTGEVGVGLMGVFGNNAYQAGRYTGLNTSGLDLVGNFDLSARDPWYSAGTRYYELWGDNLVFQTGSNYGSDTGSGSANHAGFYNNTNNSLANAGSLGFRVGDQGTWEAAVHYNSITYTGNVVDSLYTVIGSQGYLNNNLAPFGGAGPGVKGPVTSFTIPTLTATGAMQPFLMGTRRDIIGGDFKYIMGDWTFTGAFSHIHKEGSLEESYYGSYGGTAFALPVDFDINRYDATAAYTTRLYQASLQYTFSQFNDNNLFVSLPYPVSGTAAPFQRQAAYSLPPSNNAQYVTLMLASNAIPNTRLNLNARVGVESQNDTFAPNTADPGGANLTGANLIGLNSSLQGTSAASPDITATVYQVRLSATTNPLPNVDGRVWYGIDGRNVTMNQFAVTTGGEGGATADATPGGATNVYFAVPQDWTKQNAGFEAGYRLIPEYNTRLTVGYRYDGIDRSNAQVGHSSSNTATVAVSSDFGPTIDTRLSFDYTSRTGTLSYLTPWLNLTGSPTSATYSGAYYQAPMTSEAVKFDIDYMPMERLGTDFFLQFKNEKFDYPAATTANGVAVGNPAPLTGTGQGLRGYQSLSFGPDINWRPAKDLNVHFFYTYEMLYFDNYGNGDCSNSNTGICAGSAGYFRNQATTTTNTVGLSGEWQVTDKLKLKGNYTFSYGTVAFSEFDGVFVAVPTQSFQNVMNYPDINTTMQDLRLTATYELTPSIQLVGQVVYSYFHNNDFNDTANAIQGAGTASISYLTPGYASPNWSVAAVLGAVKFRFGQSAPPLPPVASAAAPAAATQPSRSYLVFFDWDKATLTDRARQIVKDAADNSVHVQYTRIEVSGYTDTSGTPQYNQGLSVRRAEAVKAELMKDGVPVNAITTKGFGETHLLVPTGPGVREPQNRRVEIVIL